MTSVSSQVFDWFATTYSMGFFVVWGVMIILYAWLHVAERLFPAERNHSYRSMIVTNGRITLVYAVLGPVGMVAAQFFTGYAVATLARQPGAPWLVIDLNRVASIHSDLIRHAILLLIAFLPILAYDFFYYWFHRLQHANSWLWEQHKLHHSDAALNVTTAYRLNWLEDCFKALFVSVAAGLVFSTHPVQAGSAVVFVRAIFYIWGLLIHSNIRISFGLLTPVLTGPQYHRIHHSIETHHQNKNFASYFPILDALFGTYYRPSDKEYPQTGVSGEPSDPTVREVLVGPILAWSNRLVENLQMVTRRRQRGPRRVRSSGFLGSDAPPMLPWGSRLMSFGWCLHQFNRSRARPRSLSITRTGRNLQTEADDVQVRITKLRASGRARR